MICLKLAAVSNYTEKTSKLSVANPKGKSDFFFLLFKNMPGAKRQKTLIEVKFCITECFIAVC